MTRLVSVLVPCRNERAHIEAFCADVLRQQLPAGWALEVLVADGRSDDGTAELLQRLAAADARLRVIDNPARIVPAGLNRALEQARGEVLVRMDVHTRYAPDYVARCLEALATSGADNVGGPWRAEGETPMQRAVAAVFQSRWLAGGARSRQLDYDGPVDTVYLGCWPRRTFERFGGFDEALARNQDDEHNLRIVKGGGRVWQSSAIRSAYRPRGSLRALYRQYLQYGYWKPFVMRKHGQPAALRHLVPGAFVLALAGSVAALPFGAPAALPAVLAGAYAAAVLAASLAIAARAGWGLWWRLPGVIAAYHFGYGIGSLWGWFDVLRGAAAGRERFARLTR
ncbi:glycosyltransferase family 2 protein [Caldimonas thermodepolymerans]|jgi:succinoglycan biosynthesis protein ExoA|uniref:Cellulose synthase/poly-beta-1,6-N-acetylglucosamine synthase-like glycosyltransferase n=1 Tax=Caldimonas thermodepolymerans TaxID=215580 RepID=A0A2S5T8S4_9BURK|nr:glycosyltransferase family 2 protein [Caldimonas thermodepolymerans]PPE71268.1 glycosyltransferase family 2 protein [Caldimonas thermodepolymerans]QPC32442.1 glycosyltransferase family 2 protein [Caldimonas thermodepolymerans]RDH98829.1 cellulose synthase/poly-beta-1,6-N-acetylglucosamine synthase-like glycosyltransferase [Caldimonas thermodepolymerans]TCP06227.1 cellulose synthase/poly-beta-1,6-N-acetylglucosamine synthase-like glycosyltransferase [Caldimonas thermodepolymerans]UZG45238.1 